jgi:hypothetical protein
VPWGGGGYGGILKEILDEQFQSLLWICANSQVSLDCYHWCSTSVIVIINFHGIPLHYGWGGNRHRCTRNVLIWRNIQLITYPVAANLGSNCLYVLIVQHGMFYKQNLLNINKNRTSWQNWHHTTTLCVLWKLGNRSHVHVSWYLHSSPVYPFDASFPKYA